MYADDFDEEQNGGEAHAQEEEEVPEAQPQETLAQSEQASKAKAALEQIQKLEAQQKEQEDAKKK